MRRRRLSALLAASVLLAGAGMWAWLAPQAPEPLPPPGRLTIHGVAPGMHWSEVVGRLGVPASDRHDGEFRYARWTLPTGWIAADSKGDRVAGVSGDQLESDGKPWLRAGDDVAPARESLGPPYWRVPHCTNPWWVHRERWEFQDNPEWGCSSWQGLALTVERKNYPPGLAPTTVLGVGLRPPPR